MTGFARRSQSANYRGDALEFASGDGWRRERHGVSSTRFDSRTRWLAAGFIVLCVAGAAWLYSDSADGESPSTPVSSSPGSVAVLWFDNLSGDPSLDWLELAFAEMLATNLSQAEELRVLRPEDLRRLAANAGVSERSSELHEIESYLRDSGIGHVFYGSFVKAGEAIRVDTRLRDLVNEELLASEAVEGALETDLFEIVDELTARAMPYLGETLTGVSYHLNYVTTPSLEAYALFHQAMAKQLSGASNEERMLLFKDAVALDPEFALALAKLSTIHKNLGNVKESSMYSERAFASRQDRSPRSLRW